MSKNLLKSWFKRLHRSKAPEPILSLKHIIEDVLLINIERDLSTIEKLVMSDAQVDKIDSLVLRREQHEPIQYILGQWPFRNLDLEMRCPVFIPRPETEQLIDLMKRFCRKNMKTALEIGVGSGPIALSLLKETDLEVFGIDKSQAAIDLTMNNIQRNNLNNRNFRLSKLALTENCQQNIDKINKFINKRCDIIVSNPPYVPSDRLAILENQIIRYESIDALNGGPSGLDVIKLIMSLTRHIAVDGGFLFLEIDEAHPPIITELLQRNPIWNLKLIDVFNDIFDRPRFVVLQCQL